MNCPEKSKIAAWIERCIEGHAGMNSFEEHEVVIFHDSDRVAAAKWIVRCLGNPDCEGSRDVVLALMERHGIEAT